jgi:WD40 repeat protein/class 3 adenylate cyclase
MRAMIGKDGPAGILTFLIADVRGYTSFTQEHGDEAAARLAGKFAEVTREAIEAHGGDLTELRGDEALCVFTSPRSALRAAADLQTVYADETALDPSLPMRVGIGLDSGEAVAVAGGYRGGALNLAARLCSRALAGQIFASQGVVHLARAVEGIQLEVEGDFELKGLSEPVRVFRAIADRAVMTPPTHGPTELPAALQMMTPIIGGDIEVRRLRWMWRMARRGDGRVVALVGPTGIGKTRLAAEVAAAVAADGGVARYGSFTDGHEDVAHLLADGEGPRLVVFDRLDAAEPSDLSALFQAAPAVRDTPTLVALLLDDDQAAPELLTGALRLVGGDDAIVRPRRLDMDQMRQLAALYAGAAAGSVPSQLLTDTGGVPRKVHEEVSRWAYTQATRRLGTLADQAATGRSGLRSVEADLAGTVVDLQQVREQTRLFGLVAGGEGIESGQPPYRGLTTFEASDAEFFFGRERLLAEIVSRLAGTPLLGIVGPSGSGKSSVVRAGLIPGLAAGVLPGSERWTVALLRPGEHPLRELDRALWAALPKATLEQVAKDAVPLVALNGVLGDGERLVVIADAFEEAFTVCTDEQERAAFIAALIDAATDPRAKVVVVLAIRADYYGRCADDARLADLLAANHVLVGPMSADEYRRAIVQPALRVGTTVEPELVDDLVSEVLGEPGALPLLSTTLLELWDHRDGRTMRRETYLATGGVRGAVARLADAVYDGFDPNQQAIVRSIMLRLAGPGEGESAVRRRVPLFEFDAERNPEVAGVLEVLANRRLVTISDGTVEVAHEALLREWPRLQGWLEEDREGRRLRQHLIVASREWVDRDKDPGELYRGARLSAALDYTTDHTLELNELEREFVTTSRAQSQRELVRQRRQNRRLRGLLGGVAVLLIVALAAGLVALTQKQSADAAARVALARQLGAEALITPRVDEAMLLARESVLLDASIQTKSTLLATLLRVPSAIGTFSTPIGATPVATAVSPDGRTLAVSESTGAVEFFDTRTYQRVHAPLSGYNAGVVGAGTMGYAGPYFYSVHTPSATTGQAAVGTIDLFDAVSMAKLHSFKLSDTFLNHPTGIEDPVLVSPDGRYVSFAFDLTDPNTGADQHTYVDSWSVTNGAFRELALPSVGMNAAVFLPGDRLLVATDSAVVTVDGPSMREIASIPLQLGGSSVAISPDGKRLALSSGAPTFTIWDLTAHPPQATTPAVSPSAGINSMQFTPDGKYLVTASSDQTAGVWDAGSGALAARLTGLPSGLLALSISPDGSTLYTASSDGGVIFQWDLSGARGFGRPFHFQAIALPPTSNFFFGTPALAVSPDGSRFAVRTAPGQVGIWSVATLREVNSFSIAGGAESQALGWFRTGVLAVGVDGGVQLWHLAPVPARLLTLTGVKGTVKGVAVSPDGRYVAAVTYVRQPASSPDGWLGVWDAGSGRLLSTFHLGADGRTVAFSPDAPLLVTAMGNNQAVVFDYIHGRVVRMLKALVHDTTGLGAPSSVEGLTFFANGDLLMGEDAGVVQTWDPRTGRPLQHPIQADQTAVASLAVLPDQSAFVTTSASGDLKLWDSESLQQFGSTFPGTLGVWSTAAVTPDGKNLVVVYADGSGFVWPLALSAWMDHACAVAHRNLTQEEWSRFVANQPYQRTCPNLPSG